MRKRLVLPGIACGALLCATTAVAQYDDTLRPPGSVPVRPAPSQYPPQQYAPPPPQYAPPPQYPPPQWQGTPPSAAAPVRPGAIQSEELPAPGAPGVQPAAMPPPGQGAAPNRQQQRPAAPPPAAPADVVTPPPQQRISNPTAVFNGLDKITGRITSFESAIGETVQFGALQVTARACYSRPPTETPLTDGFIEVDEVTLQGDVRRIFTGWMFAASPGLHAVEHAVYDIWLVDCKGGGAQAAAEPQPATPAAASPSRQSPRQGNGQQRSPQQRPPAPPQSGAPR